MASKESREGKAVAKYVGYKISRVRWKPQPPGAIRASDIFSAGSWDDQVNRVAVWRYDPTAVSSSSSFSSPPPGFHKQGLPAVYGTAELVEPECVCEVRVGGDVMDLEWLDETRMVVGLSTGSVALLHFRPIQKTLIQSMLWERVHYIASQPMPRPVTAVATSCVTIVTGGEDGRINILHPDHSSPLQTIENADNATVTGLVCTMKTEVLSTSSSGQLKLWDLRSSSSVKSPSRILVISKDPHPLHCLDRCPNQPHLVAVGRGNGSVCFWDLRQDKHPVSILNAHASHIWEIKFHRHNPNHLFTCSQDCSLWHWDASPSSSSSSAPTHTSTLLSQSTRPPPSSSRLHEQHLETDHTHQSHEGSTPWLSGAALEGKFDIGNILANRLPVNSFDVESRHLVCGTDNEMLYLVPNLTLR